MAESACLVRSFSNPADVSREAKESDPARALTESVSFGRFMSESLAWEKWSTFSHNRYLEEVEKFSKPGSVAQKKAFFEAHYKRRAAMRAAALLEQANASQTGTSSAALIDSSLNTDAADANPSVPMDEEQEKDVSDAEVVNCVDVDACNLNIKRDNMAVTVSERGQAIIDQEVDMDNNARVEDSKALENVDNRGTIMASPDKKIPNMECNDQKDLTTSSKKRRTNSLSKSSTPSRPSKLPLHPSKRVASAQARCDTAAAKSTANSNDKKKTTPNSLHMSINFASGASKTSKSSLRMPKDTTPLRTPTRAFKKAADQENVAPSSEKGQSNSTSKLSNHGGVSKQINSRIGNNHALINKKSAVDSNEQRRVVQKSLHMSTNFTPHVGETNKTSLKKSRDSSTALQTPTRASVTGGLKHPSKVLHSQNKRTRAVLNKSASGGITGDGRWPSLSNCSKSSSASITSAQSPIASSPFHFRSEERAAKRKEFFKKLEDKMNSEAEKSQMQLRPKEKVKNDLNKLRWSTNFKARRNEDLCRGSQSSHNDIKIPSNLPQSTKIGRKPFPSMGQDANSRPPKRPSINTESSKSVLMKYNRIACSVTSLPQNRHENASPNIQLSVGKESLSKRHERAGSVAGGCSY